MVSMIFRDDLLRFGLLDSSRITSLCGLSLVLLILYGLGSIIYNLYFHPLAKFSGPKVFAATHFPYFWALGRGELLNVAKELVDEYGPVIRIRPNTLYFTTSQTWRDIYGHRPGKRPLQHDPETYFNRNKGAADILRSNDADHSRIRKLLANAFSEQALRDQEPIITAYIDLLICKLLEQAQTKEPHGGVVDIVKWFTLTTFDIVGDLSFSKSFGGLESGEYHFYVSNIFRSFQTAQYFIIARAYPLVYFLGEAILALFGTKFLALKVKHLEYTAQTVNKRLATQTDKKDFMTYILRHNDEKGMTRQEIMGTAAVLVAAGSETTASLLSGAVFHLLKNEIALRKLTDEVRSSFANEDEITFAAVARLPYLQAVIDESLRIYPPVPGALPRRTPPEGDVIDGYAVPGNITVATQLVAANLSASNFYEPKKFIPERWLGDPRFVNDNRAVSQPFSFGARNCIGKNLAYAEVRTILARLLWKFDMELCAESQNWAVQKSYFIWAKGKLLVKMKERKMGNS